MKRRAIQVVVLLVLGAIVNVAVAWGLATRPRTQEWRPPFKFSPYAGNYQQNSFKYWRVETDKIFGGLKVVSGWMDVDIWIGSEQYGQSDTVLPTWGTFLAPPKHSTPMSMVHTRSAEAWGLPMLSLIATWAGDGPYVGGIRPVEQLVAGIEIAPERYVGRNTFVPRRTLPLRPIWPGFAINTIFYAAMLWVVFFVPGMVRRTIRRKRGLCPACAYPIGSSPVCTECGAEIPSPLRGRE